MRLDQLWSHAITFKDEYVSPEDAREMEIFHSMSHHHSMPHRPNFFLGQKYFGLHLHMSNFPDSSQTSAFPYIFLVNMEKTIFLKTSIPYLDSPTKSTSYDELPTSPLVLVVDSYPDNLVIKYLVAPFAKHLVKTILALLAFLFGSLTVCGHWNSEEVCSLRFHYMAFLIAVGILGLTGYAYHLRRTLEKEGRISRKA
ncbi:hypothetical protein N7519_001818 [Penicillium mononematosum]|uniref:uncharacterized protein n=1 Tax=Penicillium mononematosum TaxID=268346 RepID=UPI00254884C4|nr:uncharacterized protein N7519_001818 [Penicillium mononematosum]KAJ6186910.1 hypothetical protein N7519_001818 [Penicillium mononematosum]